MKNCLHCGAPVPTSVADDRFCCHGCATVFSLLHDAGLQAYYQQRDQSGLVRPEERIPAEPEAHDAIFADKSFLAESISLTADHRHNIRLQIEGMHCAACVWLLERLPHLTPGVSQARVAFVDRAIDLIYDPSCCDVSTIAREISKLGYRPHPWQRRDNWLRAKAERRAWSVRFAVAAACAVGSMHLAINLFAGDLAKDMDAATRMFFASISALIALPVITWCCWPYHRAAFSSLQHGHIGMDMAVSVVVLSGWLISVVHMLFGRSDVYFDAVTMFAAFLIGGRIVFLNARDRVAGDADALAHLLPRQAQRRATNGQTYTVPLTQLRVGDQVQVETGGIIPADGIVIDHTVEIDAAVLTGENQPVVAPAGSPCWAGTKVAAGPLMFTLNETPADSRMADILDRVRQAQPGDDPLQQMVDRILSAFTPLMFIGAIACGLLWLSLDPSRAWDQAIAFILVACPCVLGLAVPLVRATAIGRAARHDILIRDAAALERIGHCKHIVCDKTGTLTTAQAKRTAVVRLPGAEAHGDDELARYALSLARLSDHPLASALVRAFEADMPSEKRWHSLANRKEIPGAGVQAESDIGVLQLGSAAFIGCESPRLQQHGSVVLFAVNHEPVFAYFLRDPIRDDSRNLIAFFRQQRLTIHIASGDRQTEVQAIADELGIDSAHCHGAMGPEEKCQFVEQLRADGGCVMIGDGLNDAAALQAADVGIGLRGGLAAALAVSPIYCCKPKPSLVIRCYQLAARSRRIARWCLAISLAYNLVGLAFVLAGYWGPWVCAIAMPLSSISVILLAILGMKPASNKNTCE